MTEQLKVNEQSAEVVQMAKDWPIVKALLGGTRAMRTASVTHMPKWPNEEQASYDARLTTATLYPALRRTISVMTGKPFSKEMTLGDDVPEALVELAKDINLEGQNLHSFSASLFDECLAYGLCGILVDYPVQGNVKTKADEKRIAARPYFVKVNHDCILGWKSKRGDDGTVQLIQLRLMESKTIDDGLYGTKVVPVIRVLTPGTWETWALDTATNTYLADENGTTSLNVIPFVPFYGFRTGYMTGMSPFIDLAHLNVKHWQSQSDQDTILHVARVPILCMSGAETDTALTVGSSTAVKLPMGGTLTFVEHSGSAIGAGATAIFALEDQMVQTGAEILVNKALGGTKTATEARGEGEGNKCDLQRIIESFEDSLDQALQLAALWLGEKDGGHAALFKDFGIGSLTDASAQLLLSLQQGGIISKNRLFVEQQRRGVLDAALVPADEISAAEEDGPPLGNEGDPGIPPGPGTPPADPAPADPAAPTAPVGMTAEQVTQAITDAFANMPPPVVTVNVPAAPAPAPVAPAPAPAAPVAPIDLTPVVAALTDAVTALRSMPPPTINVSPPNVTVEGPTINTPAVNVTVERGSGNSTFKYDAAGNIIGAQTS